MAPTDAFDDDDKLQVPASGSSEQELRDTLKSLFRAELAGDRDGAIESAIKSASSSADRAAALLCFADALGDEALVAWIEADSRRRARALAIVRAVAPPDPEAAHNAAVSERVKSFEEWSRFSYRLIVVPGFTPPDATVATREVHPVTQKRLQMAAEDFRAGKAPFILVSGANVYPRGTPYYEAVGMKVALCAMGIDEERIVVETRARHTTTNLRNSGRFMRAHQITAALIVTKGGGAFGSDFFGQDFYLSHPTLSTFHGRCERELGYRVGDLRSVEDGRIELTPAPEVDRPSYRDPLDP